MGHRLKDLGFKTAFIVFPAVIIYILLTDGNGCGDKPRDFRFFPIAGASAFLLAIHFQHFDIGHQGRRHAAHDSRLVFLRLFIQL